MFAWLAQFLTAPIINGFLAAYQKKLDASNTTGAQAVEVTKAALLAEIEARKNATVVVLAQQGKWYSAWPMLLVQAIAALFFAKCVFWDNMLGLGSTDPLNGDVQTTYNIVMSFWFGGAAVKGAIIAARTWWR